MARPRKITDWHEPLGVFLIYVHLKSRLSRIDHSWCTLHRQRKHVSTLFFSLLSHSLCVCVCLPVSISLSLCFCVCLSVSLPFCLSVCLRQGMNTRVKNIELFDYIIINYSCVQCKQWQNVITSQYNITHIRNLHMKIPYFLFFFTLKTD